jgi:eukaryotic-like serine/threonine-protein kinase
VSVEDEELARATTATSRPGEQALDKTLPSSNELTVASVSVATDDYPPVPRGTEIGRYIVLDPLGAGAMGVVVSAIDPTLDRKVAIKFVKADRGGTSLGRQRLLREAQAMARLSHPNVVTVFEAGTFNARVYLAMEYVAGTTLAGWLAKPRSPKEIIEVFIAAGRGLSAAHRAGIVHRDFKPANVLVGNDARVRVADFGLATATERAASSPPIAASESRELGMTSTGEILGTPTYMAPEQHRGVLATAQADQFAFCVALWEALRGELPFEGTQYTVYAGHVLAGETRDTGRAISARQKKVLLRGMALDPAHRYPDMDALIAELSLDTTQRVKLAALAAVTIAIIAVGAFALLRRGADPCAFETRQDVWSASNHTALVTAFAESGARAATQAARRTTELFEARQVELDAGRHAACVATAVTHEQSAELLDRRVRCLDRRAGDARALVAVLIDHPTAPVVAKAIESTLQLAPVADCADRDTLLAEVPPPPLPIRPSVALLEDRLSAIHALQSAGKLAAARTAEDQLLPEADRTAYLPLRAHAHLQDAFLDLELERNERALVALRETTTFAAAAHDDAVVARSEILIMSALGYRLGRTADARLIEPLASAAVARAGSSAELRGYLDSARGLTELRAADYAAAAAHFHTAATEMASVFGPDDSRLADDLGNEGASLQEVARYDEARKVVDRSLAIRVKAYGEIHPDVAGSYYQLGVLLDTRGQPELALGMFQKALAIQQQVYPADHPQIAATFTSLGVVLLELDRPEEAVADSLRAVELFEKAPTDNRVSLGTALIDLGNAYRALGKYHEAIETQERALEIDRGLYDEDHVEIADIYDSLAETYSESGHPARATDLWQHALAIREKRLGPDHPDVANTLDSLAHQDLKAGHYAEALARFERAVKIYEKAGLIDSKNGRGMVAGRDEARQHLRR